MTDDRGRYRLTGLPIIEPVALRAEPAEGQPYHMSAQESNNRPGTDATRLDFALKHGVLIRGRVIDQATGGPIAALVEYHPTVETRTAIGHGNRSCPRAVRRMPTVVSPSWRPRGRAWWPRRPWAIASSRPTWSERVTPSRLVPSPRSMGSHGRVDTTPSPRSPPTLRPNSFTPDLALTPGLDPTVEILDADGRPMAGAVVGGIPPADVAREGWWQSREKAAFRVTGLTGRRIRVLSIHHEARRLAGSLAVRDNEPGPLIARLRPWGVVSGRLVDGDGRPRPGVLLSCRDSVGTYHAEPVPLPQGRRDRRRRSILLRRSRARAGVYHQGPRRRRTGPPRRRVLSTQTGRGQGARRCPGGRAFEPDNRGDRPGRPEGFALRENQRFRNLLDYGDTQSDGGH